MKPDRKKIDSFAAVRSRAVDARIPRRDPLRRERMEAVPIRPRLTDETSTACIRVKQAARELPIDAPDTDPAREVIHVCHR